MAVASTIRRVIFLVLAGALLVPATVAPARSKPDPDKYAQKVAHKLAHFKKGALVHLTFADASESTGTLGQLGDASFTLFNVESNATETHRYADVDQIAKGKNEIGASSEHTHHLRL